MTSPHRPMNIFMKLKRKLGFCFSRSKFLMSIARKVNLMIFHWDKRQQDRSFGPLNPSVRFYVIRPSGTDEGLLSLYLGTLSKVHRCLDEGFVPVVDWQNYMTQYNVDFQVKGTRNAWEYYFSQPCSYSLEEVYQSRNVRLSGWVLRDTMPPPK